MRPTYAIVKPTGKDRRFTGKLRDTEKGYWEILAIAPRGLEHQYVALAAGDIPEVRIVPLSNLHYYGISHINKAIIPSLPLLLYQNRGYRSNERYFDNQKLEADKLRRKIKKLEGQ